MSKIKMLLTVIKEEEEEEEEKWVEIRINKMIACHRIEVKRIKMQLCKGVLVASPIPSTQFINGMWKELHNFLT